MSQDYYGRNSRFTGSWNVINNDLYDDDENRYYPSYVTDAWSVLDSQDVREDQLPSLPQNNNSGLSFNNYGSSTISTIQERNPTPPVPEPEFTPSISSSTKGFLEKTFRYERKNEEDIVGRPDEYDDDDCCPPPPQLSSDSDIQSDFLNDNSQSIVRNFVSITPSFSWDFVRYSLAVLIIGIIIYYFKDFPFVEFNNIF